jgi:pimeloyl-ACP methyl ester carboxylesterase
VSTFALMMLAALAARGDFDGRVDIGGGRRLFLECRGKGSPTVILESGLRTRGDNWSRKDVVPPNATPVMAGVAAFARVCAYDRPGTSFGVTAADYSRSDPVRMPRTSRAAVSDLHALLRAAGVSGPYVLVGHSFGGVIVRQYASSYPKDVVGLVLVDALPEFVKERMTPAQWTIYTGLNTKPPPGLEKYKDIEVMDFDASLAQLRRVSASTPLRSMPVVVLSKGRPFQLPSRVPPGFADALNAAWAAAQDRLAAALPHARHVVVEESSHYIEIERPDLVVKAVRVVVDAVRAGRPQTDWSQASHRQGSRRRRVNAA